MIKYDYTYFHSVLLQLKSIDFNLYQHHTEKDLLISALNGEEITDYSTINWRWISNDLYGEEYTDDGKIYSFDINGELEKFIRRIIPRDEVVRILTFLRDHCRECLFGEFYDEQCVCNFETECARLISQNIEESKRDQFHGDFREWPRPNLREIAMPPQNKPVHTDKEKTILKAIPNYPANNPPVSKDALLRVAYEFIEDFRAAVKNFEESGRNDRYKPCMSYKQHAEGIYNRIIKRANRYLYWYRDPVYQVFFILGCLMGVPDHHRTWYEQTFAEGIGDYLELTKNFKGAKANIQSVIRSLLALGQQQLNFDAVDPDDTATPPTTQPKQKTKKAEDEQLLSPGQEVDPDFNAFIKLITYSDRGAVLSTLHQRIDGRKGKDIGIVLAAATYKYNVLSRTPTESEFREEFPNIKDCSWRSISEWLKKVDKPEQLRPDIKDVELDL